MVSDAATTLVQVLRASDRSLVLAMRQGTLKRPGRLACSPDGSTVFVSDRELPAVFQYRLDGILVRQIASNRPSAGKFDDPWGLAVSKAGEPFVADSNNHRMKVLRGSDGPLKLQIGGTCGTQGSWILQFLFEFSFFSLWDVMLFPRPDWIELLVLEY